MQDNENMELEEQDGADEQEEPPGPSQGTSYQDDEDGSTCPVCLEAWTNCGDHRMCALKCGHLFGHKCILRWLDVQTKKCCPTCKKPVRRSDLRFIYAKKLIAVDNVELESLRVQLETALAQKNSALQNVSKYISREHVLKAEIEQLKRRVQELTSGCKATDLKLAVNRVRLYMEKNLEICSKNGCRDCKVFDISVQQDALLVTSRAPSDLFGAFGVKQFSLSNYKPIKFIPIHKEPIRDMCLHPTVNSLVLTVSTEKKFKVTETHNTSSQSVSLDSAPWACTWNPRNSNEFFIGTQNGTVSLYDLRKIIEPKLSLSVLGDFSPVVSMIAIQEPSGSDIIVAARLNAVWAFECYPDGSFNRHILPLEGPFLSLRYDKETKQILVSSRPNKNMPFARHTVCHLEKTRDPDLISCNTVYSFKGGSTAKLLAKTSCFAPNNIVAGHHETRKSILLFSVNTGEEVGSCPTNDNLVFDMNSFETPGGDKFLTYLNERKIEFFKFNVA
ncbi:unnamed protein product [Ceutorhynchus assimilis]|uniref:RING-type E3 ubiquitin transferase n=1 Tax=Ceutorhynchus assimilis TaxID=467358 RepID=A0A9P0DHQ3_9CUCU|nr:unnamed protein product [Ceutorhynchus assimilis]